jgi:hypothetical protein
VSRAKKWADARPHVEIENSDYGKIGLEVYDGDTLDMSLNGDYYGRFPAQDMLVLAHWILHTYGVEAPKA